MKLVAASLSGCEVYDNGWKVGAKAPPALCDFLMCGKRFCLKNFENNGTSLNDIISPKAFCGRLKERSKQSFELGIRNETKRQSIRKADPRESKSPALQKIFHFISTFPYELLLFLRSAHFKIFGK